MKKVKVYISLPMGGFETTVRRRYDDCVKWLRDVYYKSYSLDDIIISGPINIDEFTDEGIKTDRDHDWNWYIGEDIKELLSCNTIVMTRGWKNSPGCRVEFVVAKERGMHIIFTDDSALELNNYDLENVLDAIELERWKSFNNRHLGKCRIEFIHSAIGTKYVAYCEDDGYEEDITNYKNW